MLQRGDNLIISAELLDVRDNKQIWGEQYNLKLADALGVQQQISREITDRLRLKLSGTEQKQLTRRDTTNAESYQSYLRGRYYWNKRTGDNLRKAIAEFQQAADKDPNYALAYTGLADSYVLLEDYTGASPSEVCPKAKAYAERALQLDPSLAEAHASLAYTYTNTWQWDQAEAEYQRAFKLDPNYGSAHQWYSLHLRYLGRFDEGMREATRSTEIDPLSLINAISIAQSLLGLGKFDATIEQGKKIIELDPNFPKGYEELGLGYLAKRQYPEAITQFQKGTELGGRARRSLAYLGFALAASGKRDEALVILKELQGKYQKHEALAQDVAAVYVGLGEKEQAFAWLEKGFQDHSGQLGRIRWEPPWDSLRSDPRYGELLKRMGLKA
jgi:tetratricopeptide (TPR) repeat protein